MTAPQRKHSPTTQGERQIAELLTIIGVNWQREVALDGLKHLFFDFAICDEHGTTKALLEFQGPQHTFHGVFYDGAGNPYTHSPLALHKQQMRDRQKAKFCLDNNLPLLVLDGSNVVQGALSMSQIMQIKAFLREV